MVCQMSGGGMITVETSSPFLGLKGSVKELALWMEKISKWCRENIIWKSKRYSIAGGNWEGNKKRIW